MRVLALEPYYGGSHLAFLDGWSSRSRHEWTILTLPAYKWKWRMRHAAITFAREVENRCRQNANWDVLFCSDMLNLAEFKGLAPQPIRRLPGVAYFHENQLTYPVRCEDERDYQYAFTNMTTVLAAEQVWFNSAYHRDDFLDALGRLLLRMPDHQPFEAIERIRSRSSVQPPGIEPVSPRRPRRAGPVRILWSARWEFDKDPETFFAALARLKKAGTPFRVSVLGQCFRDVPPVFARAKEQFADSIDHWGYCETRAEYESVLSEADVVVSTARHEFFGIGLIEAVSAGAFPLVPMRLAYPEVLRAEGEPDFFYQGGAVELAERIKQLIERNDLWQGAPDRGRRGVEPYHWPSRIPQLDAALENLVPA